MASIFIYNYNNYYNRRVRGQNNTLSDYGTPIYIESGNAVNFNPADGVNTIFVAGKMSNSYTGKGDYFIYSEDNVSITSRWFILEADRTRNGQYRLQLRRDVIVDNYDAVINAKSFISKATLSDDNPLIYNQEAITTNQIKTKEIELKDDTGIAWIVGYIARNTAAKDITLETPIIIEDGTVEDWAYKDYINGSIYKTPTSDLYFAVYTPESDSNKYGLYKNMSFLESGYRGFTPQRLLRFDSSKANTFIYENQAAVNSAVKTYGSLYQTREVNNSDYSNISSWNGKILKDASGNYFRIKLEYTFESFEQYLTEDKSDIYLSTYLINLFNKGVKPGYPASGGCFKLVNTYPTIKVSLVSLTYGAYKLSFPGEADRYHLKDAPYDMFCIPYTDNVKLITGVSTIITSKSLAVNIAQQIAISLDKSLYDLQILPFCPFTGYTVEVNGNIGIDISNTKRYTYIQEQSSTGSTIYPSILIWCTASSGTKDIKLKEPLTYTNKKIANQCDLYRLVSPNYSGQFEFSLAKNNTPSLDTFNVDYTYMPYNPYIHINPIFSGLYGQDFNDARGLICGGDFSLARVSDAWEQYQLQNKNYQAIFDRQIQKMDVDRKYQRIEEGVGAVAGSFQTSAQGFMVGGGIGAAVGGVLGLSAGLGDMALSEGKYNEQKSYATDIHNMQLENIRALPYSLSKTTAFTFNNKIFPIIEYYTCTDQERIIIADMIANQGMTAELVGNIINYIYNQWSYDEVTDRGFIRATIIKIDIEDDTHLANAISEELQKGVYFK